MNMKITIEPPCCLPAALQNITFQETLENIVNKITFLSNADHPRMRAFSYACSLPVTWQRWRGYTIRSVVPENPILHANINITTLCLIERDLLPIEVLHCENRNFLPICLMRPWPWPDNLYIRNQPVDRGYIPRVQIWTSYVKAFENYRLTYTGMQTRPKYSTPLRGWSKNNSGLADAY